jgi:hypothetical protein
MQHAAFALTQRHQDFRLCCCGRSPGDLKLSLPRGRQSQTICAPIGTVRLALNASQLLQAVQHRDNRGAVEADGKAEFDLGRLIAREHLERTEITRSKGQWLERGAGCNSQSVRALAQQETRPLLGGAA